MPSRNVVRSYSPHSYYHVYNRAVDGQQLFLESVDKKQFIKIFARHLDPTDTTTKTDGVVYRKFNDDLDLLCYCLMGNHFHLLFYMRDDPASLAKFMQSTLTAYTMYFNKKYRRKGTLFQGVFKASHITQEPYLIHISRYIHLNPRSYKTYQFSSLQYFTGQSSPNWLNPQLILDMFEGDDYMSFLEDYEEQKTMLDEIKNELANQ